MNDELNKIVEEVKLRNDPDMDNTIVDLHGRGLTIVQSMCIISLAYGVGLARAKVVVSQHPIWSEVAGAGDELHSVILETFQSDEN